VPTTWITNVPYAGGCKAASQDTAPVRERQRIHASMQKPGSSRFDSAKPARNG
jgi:hypothetical protein